MQAPQPMDETDFAPKSRVKYAQILQDMIELIEAPMVKVEVVRGYPRGVFDGYIHRDDDSPTGFTAEVRLGAEHQPSVVYLPYSEERLDWRAVAIKPRKES